MATALKIALRNQYFLLPDGPTKTAVGDEFLRLYGVTPEQDLLNEQQGVDITVSDPSGFNAGFQILDTDNNGDILAFGLPNPGFGDPSAGLGGNPTERPTDGSSPGSIGGPCSGGDYRYIFDCPIFQQRPTGGCDVFLPISRVCIQASFPSDFFSLSGPQAIINQPEFVGYLNITDFAKSALSETRTDYVKNGVKGTLTVYETQFDEESFNVLLEYLRTFLNYGQSLLDSRSFADKYITTTDISNPNRPVTRIVKDLYGKLHVSGLIAKIYNPNPKPSGPVPTSSQGVIAYLNPPITIDDLVASLKKFCKTKTETFCKYEGIFEPDPPAPDPTPKRYTDPKQIELFGSRRPTGERFSRPVDPNATSGEPEPHPDKKCVLAIRKLMENGEFWRATLVNAVYDNPQFTGTPIEFVNPVDGPKYAVVYETVSVWEEVGRDPNCKYTIEEKLKEVEDPADSCRILVLADIYRHYEDGVVELESRDVFRRSYRKQDAECSVETVKVYHPMDIANDMMTAKIRAKTKGLFNGLPSLLCHHTSSTQSTASKEYYYDVTDCGACDKTSYFSVSYGHYKGSGSLSGGGEPGDTATHAIYSQCRLMALEAPETQFTFYTNGVPTSSNDVYVINFSRIGMSDRIDPGNWELALSELSGSFFANNIHTGSNVRVSTSNKVLTFIDNSGDTSEQISSTHDPYNSYEIVSGSLTNGFFPTSSRHTYGMVYPNLGIMVLDPYKLNTELGFNTVTGSNIAGDNSFKLFTSISGSGVLGSYMKARNVKYKTTNHYMVRVPSTLANFSNNPTWVSGSKGEFLHNSFKINPQTYITSVGLYDDNNELLAIAKLSRPINKSFENDVLIKIRLNW